MRPQNLFKNFNAAGRSFLIKFNSPGEGQNPASYLKECITALTNYLVDEVPGTDLWVCESATLRNYRIKW